MANPFDGIIGHARVKSGLLRAASTGRVHHAWLFAGRDGIGKTFVARRFAQTLICDRTVIGDGEASLQRCGECRHCRRMERALASEDPDALGQAHPDLTDVYASGQQIKIKQVRELQHIVSYKPFEARYRVVFVNDAHRLNDAAANAFLKTLEEPTDRTLFILLTDQVQQLLPTIVSRCQMLRFAPFQPRQVRTFLEGTGATEERAGLVSVLAEGSFGRALELVEDELEQHIAVLDELENLDPDDPAGVLDLAQAVAKDRDHLPALLTLLRAYFRDLMLLIHGATSELALQWRRDELQNRSRHTTTNAVAGALDALSEIEEALLGNVNPRLAIEHLLFQLSRALKTRG